LMAYVNAARERRRAAEVSAGLENAQATANERGPSADETRMANVMRNLQPQGTNGVFQIISMSVRTAKFSFRKALGLIRDWLRIIPGVNRFFLEQEAKIKADKISDIAKGG